MSADFVVYDEIDVLDGGSGVDVPLKDLIARLIEIRDSLPPDTYAMATATAWCYTTAHLSVRFPKMR